MYIQVYVEVSVWCMYRCMYRYLYAIRTGQVVSVGVPRAENMVLSCSISVSPGRNGFLSSSSARIQPHAQMSTPVLYILAPYRSSGALQSKRMSQSITGRMWYS